MVLLFTVPVLYHGVLVNALISRVIVLLSMATAIRVRGIVITGMKTVSPDLGTVHRGEIRGVL
ncbi:hypothetical protein DPMN_147916 [Dreissena polymorpha]|uniref:Uncharacterized protein n=1 Tax=Dreissena polymorpha TaxID=45954 RepID=A0A9D4FBH3_DREPO|nr:hypothetical protein DPMN_147916 [Dreissena polymorpha]